jgi:hypothetical protein
MRNCAYCGEPFEPKTVRSICCSRLHSQEYNRRGRPRDSRYVAVQSATQELSCCQEWRASGHGRTKCPQHVEARKMRIEELTWRGRLTDMHRISDDDWLHAGYTIH